MLRDDLIALGLSGTSPRPGAAPTIPHDLLSMPVEKLLALLRDVVGTLELADEGALRDTIEKCRKFVAAATDSAAVLQAVLRFLNQAVPDDLDEATVPDLWRHAIECWDLQRVGQRLQARAPG